MSYFIKTYTLFILNIILAATGRIRRFFYKKHRLPRQISSEETLITDGGDGDQRYFGSPLNLLLAEAPWFDGKLAWKDGSLVEEAMLFTVESGDYDGAHIILTSRVLGSLMRQLLKHGWASVIVHVVKCPVETLNGTRESVHSIGMSVVDRRCTAGAFGKRHA